LSDTQVRVHLDRLVALEYVLVHRGRNGQRYVYELVFDGAPHQGQPQLMGLIEVESLRPPGAPPETPDTPGPITTITDLAASPDTLAGGSRPANGRLAPALPMPQKTVQASTGAGLHANSAAPLDICLSTPQKTTPSYRTAPLAAEV
jgi:hypothetical protein